MTTNHTAELKPSLDIVASLELGIFIENEELISQFKTLSYELTRLRAEDAELRAELEAMEKQEPIGYFCDVHMLTPEQGKRIEQVVESAKDDDDVFPLYASPVPIPK